LSEGKATEGEFIEEKVNDLQLVALRKKVKSNLNEKFGLFEVKVNLKMKNGSSYQSNVLTPREESENPATFAEKERKFRGLAS